MAEIVVADTSPFIYLHHLRLLDLLPRASWFLRSLWLRSKLANTMDVRSLHWRPSHG